MSREIIFDQRGRCISFKNFRLRQRFRERALAVFIYYYIFTDSLLTSKLFLDSRREDYDSAESDNVCCDEGRLHKN
jgi:hypothetical protein